MRTEISVEVGLLDRMVIEVENKDWSTNLNKFVNIFSSEDSITHKAFENPLID